jgi:hypothetical protein
VAEPMLPCMVRQLLFSQQELKKYVDFPMVVLESEQT